MVIVKGKLLWTFQTMQKSGNQIMSKISRMFPRALFSRHWSKRIYFLLNWLFGLLAILMTCDLSAWVLFSPPPLILQTRFQSILTRVVESPGPRRKRVWSSDSWQPRYCICCSRISLTISPLPALVGLIPQHHISWYILISTETETSVNNFQTSSIGSSLHFSSSYK